MKVTIIPGELVLELSRLRFRSKMLAILGMNPGANYCLKHRLYFMQGEEDPRAPNCIRVYCCPKCEPKKREVDLKGLKI